MVFTEQMQVPKREAEQVAQPPRLGLFEFLRPFLAVLWKDWLREMWISSFFGPDEGRFVLSGECPHCNTTASFMPVTNSYHSEMESNAKWVAVLKCVACGNFILGIVGFVPEASTGRGVLKYIEHYPLGQPDETVSSDVPDEVREDFREALRCRWIKAYKATVLMCRRSLQVSCDREKAKGNDLFSQIDDLGQNQHITEPLKKMAHRIRLLGKKGAHGDFSDIDDTISEQDADDAITFMRHYLEHVYELPARLDGGKP